MRGNLSERDQWGARSRPEDIGMYRLAVLAVLGLGCGFLAFNFQHILAISDVRLSLAHSHRSTAFCAFEGCRLKKRNHMQDSADQGGTEGLSSAASLHESAASLALKETLEAMSARVCGSPAVDGYAHVDTKCLESSPTAKWWAAYYLRGGRQKELVAHIERAADYDGLAVMWGIGNKKASAEECAKACLLHMPKMVSGPFENLPCNAFTWCGEEVCFEPDAHTHTKGDCWLKFTEGPAVAEINFRGDLPNEYRLRHTTAPLTVQWWGGVLLPPGIQPTNGTYGPRWKW